jgi:ABC-type multidrug transport system ATPase subunit
MDVFNFIEWNYYHNIHAVMNKLHVDSVMKSYGDRMVLSDIFLECSPGEIIGLLGRNGCGKTTLLEIIFGTRPSDQKFVRVNGKQLNSASDSRRLIAFLPQQGLVPHHFRVKTALSLMCPDGIEPLLHALPFVKPLLGSRIGQLSHGERRILEVQMILQSKSMFILMDEPFNGVSPLQKDLIKSMIRAQLATKGFIITDHDYRNIIAVSTRLLLLAGGGLKSVEGEEALRQFGYLS